jgi:aminomethyltransferase
MKSTPLTEKHLALGAKMAEFAGYNMPISYTTITDEHQNVRTSVGVFDVSHMGEFIVRGKEATHFLQSTTSNDVSKLAPGEIQYSCMPNKKGGIVDDLLVYRLDDVPEMIPSRRTDLHAGGQRLQRNQRLALAQTPGPRLRRKNAEYFRQNRPYRRARPQSRRSAAKTDRHRPESIKYYTFRRGRFAGCNNVLVSATGYTGSGGFEIYARNRDIAKIWDKVIQNGAKWGIKPAGLGARDTLRLEMGYCLYGNDINDKTSPLEAGLGWITKLKKTPISRPKKSVF